MVFVPLTFNFNHAKLKFSTQIDAYLVFTRALGDIPLYTAGQIAIQVDVSAIGGHSLPLSSAKANGVPRKGDTLPNFAASLAL